MIKEVEVEEWWPKVWAMPVAVGPPFDSASV